MANWVQPEPISAGHPLDYNTLSKLTESVTSLQTQVPKIYMDSLTPEGANATTTLYNYQTNTPMIVSGIAKNPSYTTQNGKILIPVAFKPAFKITPIVTYSIWIGGLDSGEAVMTAMTKCGPSGFTVMCQQASSSTDKKVMVGAVLYHAIGW